MPRNLVICCDGTNNLFGTNNTNVVRLVQALDRDPQKQLVYYDPGVGTMPEPGFVTPLGKWFSKAFGLAFGVGLAGKIGAAYKFLMDHYQAGDQVFLYGFSRGAYTVRALAGVLLQFGLLPSGNDNLIPYLLRYSKAVNQLDGAPQDKKDAYWRLTRQFRETFARLNMLDGRGTRTVKIRFLGLWDTVSSVGWAWEPVHFPYTATNPSVEIVRHAVSLDERRAFFRQNRWPRPEKGQQNVREVWFAGVHSDVGGGYAECQGGLWRTPFLWMLRESRNAGLLIRNSTVRKLLHQTRVARPPWANRAHESLDWRWWGAEFFPKLRNYRQTRLKIPHFNLFRRREVQGPTVREDGTIAHGAELHRSLLRRIRGVRPYDPPNLSRVFKDYVTGLEKLPETLPYESFRVNSGDDQQASVR